MTACMHAYVRMLRMYCCCVGVRVMFILLATQGNKCKNMVVVVDTLDTMCSKDINGSWLLIYSLTERPVQFVWFAACEEGVDLFSIFLVTAFLCSFFLQLFTQPSQVSNDCLNTLYQACNCLSVCLTYYTILDRSGSLVAACIEWTSAHVSNKETESPVSKPAHGLSNRAGSNNCGMINNLLGWKNPAG